MTPANSYAISNPLCIDERKEITQRYCSAEQIWNDPPTCDNYQVTMDQMNPCPSGFSNTGSFCYKLIQNSSYPPKCPSPQIRHFEKYIQEIRNQENIFPIWLPVERDRRYGNGKTYIIYLIHLYCPRP